MYPILTTYMTEPVVLGHVPAGARVFHGLEEVMNDLIAFAVDVGIYDRNQIFKDPALDEHETRAYAEHLHRLMDVGHLLF